MQKRAKLARRRGLLVATVVTVLAALFGVSLLQQHQLKAAHVSFMAAFAFNSQRVETEFVSLTGCTCMFGGGAQCTGGTL